MTLCQSKFTIVKSHIVETKIVSIDNYFHFCTFFCHKFYFLAKRHSSIYNEPACIVFCYY